MKSAPVVLLIVLSKLIPQKAPKTVKVVFTSDGVGVVSGSRSESAYDLAWKSLVGVVSATESESEE